MVTFNWTAQQQAYVLSGYFWGYAITSLVGGTAAELWGPRNVVFITMLISAVLTTLSPQAARLHYLVLVGARFIIGLSAVSIISFTFKVEIMDEELKKKGAYASILLSKFIEIG